MRNKARRTVPAKHAAKVLALLCLSLWLFPIYEEGMKCLMACLAGTAITRGNNDLLSILAFAIWVPISFAWRRSPFLGASVQFGFLAALVVWLAVFARDVLRTWASYSLLLLALCFALWLFVFGGGVALAMIDRRSL